MIRAAFSIGALCFLFALVILVYRWAGDSVWEKAQALGESSTPPVLPEKGTPPTPSAPLPQTPTQANPAGEALASPQPGAPLPATDTRPFTTPQPSAPSGAPSERTLPALLPPTPSATAPTTAPSPDAGRAQAAVSKPPRSQQTYIVQAGDSLWTISRKLYGSPKYVKRIAQANGLRSTHLIRAGQVLILPDTLRSKRTSPPDADHETAEARAEPGAPAPPDDTPPMPPTLSRNQPREDHPR